MSGPHGKLGNNLAILAPEAGTLLAVKTLCATETLCTMEILCTGFS